MLIQWWIVIWVQLSVNSSLFLYRWKLRIKHWPQLYVWRHVNVLSHGLRLSFLWRTQFASSQRPRPLNLKCYSRNYSVRNYIFSKTQKHLQAVMWLQAERCNFPQLTLTQHCVYCDQSLSVNSNTSFTLKLQNLILSTAPMMMIITSPVYAYHIWKTKGSC